MKKLLKQNIVILIIFVLIALLRFWKVPELFFFGIDEEYQSLLALSIIKDFHLIWIGLSAASTGFYIGPGLVYLHSLLLWLSNLDPVILGYSAGLVGATTAIVFYWVAQKLFDRKIALISTMLYSFSSFIIYYDRRFWNSTFVPLIAILFFLSLVKSQKKPHWYIVTAILLGISFHIHASLFIFIPIMMSVLIYRLIKSRQKIPFVIYVVSSVVFLLIYSPLIIFDLNHNFDNLKTPLRMLSGMGKRGSIAIQEHFQVVAKTLSRFWFNESLGPILTSIFIFFSLTLLLIFVLKRKNQTERILAIILSFYLINFLFFPGQIIDYYFLGFFPFFSLIVGILLKNVAWKYLIPLLAIFVLFNSMTVFNWPTNTGLLAKKEFIQKTANVIGNNTFRLETMEPYIYFGGWRYLFEAYGKRPYSSTADEMFGWIYPNEIFEEIPKLKVTITETNNSYKAIILEND